MRKNRLTADVQMANAQEEFTTSCIFNSLAGPVKSHSSYLCYTLIFLCPHNVLLVMFVVLFICEQKLMTVLVTTDNGI